MSNSFTESELDALCRMVCERVRKTLSEGDDLTVDEMDQEEREQWAALTRKGEGE